MNGVSIKDIVFISDEVDGTFAIAASQDHANSYIKSEEDHRRVDKSLYHNEEAFKKAKRDFEPVFTKYTWQDILRLVDLDVLDKDSLAKILAGDFVY